MNILVITGSHRPKSNSTILANHFIKGAEEARHKTFIFEAAKKNVHACIGCDQCHMDGPCIFNDDFNIVRDQLLIADMVVFATPMYYFNFSTQIKAVIDRFYAVNTKITGNKKSALLVALGGPDINTANGLIECYKTTIDFLKWQDMGKVIAAGVNDEEAVLATDFPQKAFELGKSLK